MSIKLPKIFLDSGNPDETKKAKALLGFIDGQTTNPSLIVKHPDVAKYLESNKKLTEKELFDFYKEVVLEIRKQIAGSISVEVYADWETKAETMLKQAEEMAVWCRNIHIKFPTIPEGLKAAGEFVKKGGHVNMTLVFDQTQAAAAFLATQNNLTNQTDNHQQAHPHFLSPFLGRWDDRGYLGLDLIKNIIKMYKSYDGLHHHQEKKSHILILAASIRNLEHLYGAIALGADILTIPVKIVEEWIQSEQWIPDTSYRIDSHGLKSLRYEEIPLKKTLSEYSITSEKGSLLDEGIKKFVSDWKKLLA